MAPAVTTQTAPTSLAQVVPTPEAWVFRGVADGFDRVAVPDVNLREGDMLVRVELATVCGSDRHTVSGARTEPTPLVLGHEQVGRIVAMGPGTPPRTVNDRPLAIGDRVVWSVAVSCGACRMCARGIPNKCQHLRKYGHARMERGWELSGGLATHVHVVAGSDIVKVPDDLPAEILAPASCATATVVAALEAAIIRPLRGEFVVVSGCGMLGLTAIAMARAQGAFVIGIDPDPTRRAQARQFGALATAEPGLPGLRSAISRAVRDEPSLDGITGFGAALELSGDSSAIETLMGAADVGAVIVLAGSVFPAPPVSVTAEGITRRLLTITGVHNYRGEHLVRAVDFLRECDRELFAALVGDVVPFGDLAQVLGAPSRGARSAIRP